MNAKTIADLLQRQLAVAGTPQRAAGERAYLKSDLRHLGTTMPAIKRIVRTWLRTREAEHGKLTHDELFAVADALWVVPVHERRVAAIELLVCRPKLIRLKDMPWLLRKLRECRTWALVDPIAGSVIADLAARDPGVLRYLDRWVHDSDFWIRRSAVLGLRTLLRRDEELDRFFAYAELLLPEREFFIRKVIGWVAREVAASHPAQVSKWLRANMAAMNLTTLREPLRKLPDADELRALYDARRNKSG